MTVSDVEDCVPDPLNLPPRIDETLSLMLLGASEKEIAIILGISSNTVHVYVKSLYRKFEVNSRGELFARWMGLNNVPVPVPASASWKVMAESAIRGPMARPKSTRPTELELAVLSSLWAIGTATVGDMLGILSASRPKLTRQTLDKIVRVMLDKKLLEPVSDSRPQKYRAIVEQTTTQNSIVRDLIHRVFHGSAAKLVMRVLAVSKSTPAEMQQILTILDTNRPEK